MDIKSLIVSSLVLFCAEVKGADYCPPSMLGSSGAPGGRTELLPKANFETWTSKTIKESAILGGHKVELCDIGSPWGTSNVWAKVTGVTKTNVSVYKDVHPGHGNCIKLHTHIVEAKVLGLVNISVLAAGSLYLGDIVQPIRDTKNPMAKQNTGMKFTRRPKALMFDYKVSVVKGDRIRQNGITRGSKVAGQDMADCVLYLQKRWEDADGKIYAKRIGTLVVRWGRSTGWINNAEYTIHYGDITKESFYNSSWGLLKGSDMKYARNSKGKMVPVNEVGWGSKDDAPTHLVLQFDSSHGGAYIGSVGNTLWLDNIRLVYD